MSAPIPLKDLTAALRRNAVKPEEIQARDIMGALTEPDPATGQEYTPGFRVDVEIAHQSADGRSITIRAHAGSFAEMDRINAAYSAYMPRKKFLGLV